MKSLIFIIVGFALYNVGFDHFEDVMVFLNKTIHYKLASYFLTYLLIGTPIFIATFLINVDFNFLGHLGLQSNVLKGLYIGAIFSLPMFIGGLIQSKFADHISLPNLISKTVLAGFFEELYFRGFFFGQLFRKTKLGFLPSVLFCSILFAFGHLYQSHEPGILFGVFMTTFMGSVLFAWLYVEWNYNLWVPIFLHTLMNLSWLIFSVSDNALGTINSNFYRGLAIGLSIILTLIYKKRMGEKLKVNRETLMTKKRSL